MIKSCRFPENIIILFYWTALSGGVFFSYYPYYNYEKNYSKMIEISDIESGNLSL